MAEGSSPNGAAYKVPSTSKAGLKAGANPVDSKPVTTKQVFPSYGFLAPPEVARPENYTADYYRNGAPIDGNSAQRAPGRSLLPFGIEKEERGDAVTASIRIRGRDIKKNNEIVDYIPAYTKFILEGVDESYEERSQVVETFGDHYVFMFGQRPSIINFRGTLINSVNHNWLQDFMFFYDNYMRGTKAVELQARTILTYGGRQIEGLMLRTSNQTNAISEEGVPFNFSIILFSRNFLGFSEDFGIVRGPGGALISDPDLRALVDQQAGADGKGSSNPEVSEDQNAVKKAMSGGAPSTFTPS